MFGSPLFGRLYCCEFVGCNLEMRTREGEKASGGARRRGQGSFKDKVRKSRICLLDGETMIKVRCGGLAKAVRQHEVGGVLVEYSETEMENVV